MFLKKFVLGLFALCFFVGAGCGDVAFIDFQSSFASRPPTAFPRGTSDETIIAEYRRDLEKIAKKKPDAEVLGHIYFKRVATFEEFEELANRYELKTGDRASVLLKYQDGKGGLVLPEGVHTAERLKEEIETFEGGSYGPGGEVIGLSALTPYTSTAQLLQLWQDNPDLIRAVGLQGVRGKEELLWLPIDIGEPLQY